jgi:hypothetical protein
MKENELKTHILLTIFFYMMASCAGGEFEEPVSNLDEVQIKSNSESKKKPSRPKIVNTGCFDLSTEENVPIWVSEGEFYITKIMNECITSQGNGGFKKGSPWVGMGIPCTRGLNKFRLNGSIWMPKSIKLPFPSNCAISITKDKANEMGNLVIGIEGTKMVALTPAAIAYWELLDYNTAAPGSDVTLVSKKTIKSIWPLLKKDGELRIRLLGKENSWLGKPQYFIFEGSIKINLEEKGFEFILSETYPVGDNIVDSFIARCEKTRPKNKCVIN